MKTEFHNWLIARLITEIDNKFNTQLNEIFHHPRFQQLEASWRGLCYLLQQATDYYSVHVKIKLLSISWQELSRDLSRAIDFDQSQLFNKIYNREFGQPGGEPFGLLVGDYYINHQNVSSVNDIDTLQAIAKISAAAFVPYITSAAPQLFGLGDFDKLNHCMRFEDIFQQPEYQSWQSLRLDPDSRFIGVVLPRVLMRIPYQNQAAVRYPFIFSEEITHSAHCLWGNAAYCYAAVVIRSFNKTGWFTEIRGLRFDAPAGEVTHLPLPRYFLDNTLFDYKAPVEVTITDRLEKLLGEFGLIALTHCAKSNNLVFYRCSSLLTRSEPVSSLTAEDAELSSMLHYVLCVSRFSHYIKVMIRDKIGALTTPEDCEKFLQNWLRQYIASSLNLSHELKAKYPLRDAKVVVKKRPGSLENYLCTILISPHYQFDRVQAYLELTTEFSTASMR
ncbi:MAG: type VI secretion system contractile sheath large subunit [Proteobacteria bacterium]|nr:type VI secretion system contractile sheath large subunit [Pseudomonadota bacterium]